MKPQVFLLSFLILFSCQKEEFETIGSVKDVEGNSYETVIIGDQIWMAENLRTTKYNDGSPIKYVEDWNIEKGRYCWYDHDESYKKPHGALYNWYAVNTGKLAPKGWRIPTYEDWEQLKETLGGKLIAGGKIKKRGDGIWKEPNKLFEPDCGFNAYPSGGVFLKDFVESGNETIWWTATIHYMPSASGIGLDSYIFYYFIKNDNTDLKSSIDNRTCFFSVRCIKE
jgi:uncharacterized protein (TIGR02145 family)